MGNGRGFDLNLMYIIGTGNTPMDTGPGDINAGVVGKSRDRHAITIDFSDNWC